MNVGALDILLVEDKQDSLDLTLRAMRRKPWSSSFVAARSR